MFALRQPPLYADGLNLRTSIRLPYDKEPPMSFSTWFSGLFSQRGKANSLYHRGMKKAHAQDLEGAIADYSAVIDAKDAPPDLKSMSLFNRALVYSIQKKYDEANADLEGVLAIPQTPANLKDAARQKIERIKKRTSDA
jgi:hypothetical protein